MLAVVVMANKTPRNSLLSLASESFEHILTQLDLEAIKNIRLVCKTLSQRCLGPTFLRHFDSQTTDLTAQSFSSLHDIASHAAIGPAVTKLTIITKIYWASDLEEVIKTGARWEHTSNGPISSHTQHTLSAEEIVAAQEELAWLREQQEWHNAKNDGRFEAELIALFKSFGSLRHVELEAEVWLGREQRANGWRRRVSDELWSRTSEVASLVLKAIRQSRAVLESLSLFRYSQRCGVLYSSLASLAAALRSSGSTAGGAAIKHFALTVDARPSPAERDANAEDSDEGESTDTTAPETDEDRGHEQALLDVLLCMPNLESLNLKNYLRRRKTGAEYPKLNTVMKALTFPNLRHCHLMALCPEAETLQDFLQRHSKIVVLDLAYIHLGTEDEWTAILRPLRTTLPNLERLRLADLYDQHRMLNLAPAWQTTTPYEANKRRTNGFPWINGRWKAHTLELEGEELPQELIFEPTPRTGRALGSAQQYMWIEKTSFEYGSP
jgi:hypothetical protein